MFWTSFLPVTIFLLANTLCVSQGASVGGRGGDRQRLINLQEERLQPDDGNSPPQTISADADFPSAGSSSVESLLPEWINARHPPNNHKEGIEDENKGGGDDNLEDVGNEDWDGSPFQYRNPFLYSSSSSNRARIFPEQVMMEAANRHGTGATGARSFHYNPAAASGDSDVVRMKVGGKVIPFPGHHLRRDTRVQQPAVAAAWPGKAYYQVPAEGFIRANLYDKRSPRCIAKCMQQGMVHPLQCHSLC